MGTLLLLFPVDMGLCQLVAVGLLVFNRRLLIFRRLVYRLTPTVGAEALAVLLNITILPVK
jgi:hypothetical protein